MRTICHCNSRVAIFLCIVLSTSSSLMAQQRGLYQPGQYGLNVGVLPDPGITYVNLNYSYNAGQLNFESGKPVPIKGSYNVWAIENIFYYVPKFKVLGAKFAPFIGFPILANGSLTLPFLGNGVTVSTGSFSLTNTWIQPLTLGWHLPRADVWTGYAIMPSTGRYTPGAKNNVASGYWGNLFMGGGTFYLTKDMGTTANFLGVWEFHGSKTTRSTDISTSFVNVPLNVQKTPGGTWTDEWGLGQAIPLNKPFLKTKNITKVAQLGVVGYDQAQISPDRANHPVVDAYLRLVPFYYVHAIGVQANYIDLKVPWLVFFKYYHEYSAAAAPKGTTFTFGFVYTFRIPKTTTPSTPSK